MFDVDYYSVCWLSVSFCSSFSVVVVAFDATAVVADVVLPATVTISAAATPSTKPPDTTVGGWFGSCPHNAPATCKVDLRDGAAETNVRAATLNQLF